VRVFRALKPSRTEAIAALASGALFALAFPPFPLVLPVFLCLIPFAVLIARLADEPGTSIWSAARVGFWFGLLGYGCNLYWIAVALSLFTWLASIGYVGALIWLTPYVAATGAALFAARRATGWPLAVLVPIVWVALEVVLNYLSDLAFPWLPLGLGLASHPVMIQFADISGVRGVSFWIALVNGLLADAWLARQRVPAVAARVAGVLAIVVVMWGYGSWRMRTTTLVPLSRIAVVQPNVPQEEKWQAENRERILGMVTTATRSILAKEKPALIVWPEVALPGFFVEHPEWYDSLSALTNARRVPILFGVLDVEFHRSAAAAPSEPADYDYFNAAMLADSTGTFTQKPYRKAFLVPVVERVPFLNPKWFSGLKYFGGFGRGVNAQPYALPFGKFGVLICYESVFPQASRRYRQLGADLLINITNDAWFGRTIAPYQHHAHLAIRAVENRIGVVRSANTGISGYIDPLGRVRDETALFVSAVRSYDAETTRVRTLYVRIGDWIGMLCCLATLAFVATAWRGRKNPKN
jgi:apolipoprotein N-acyltransferase